VAWEGLLPNAVALLSTQALLGVSRRQRDVMRRLFGGRWAIPDSLTAADELLREQVAARSGCCRWGGKIPRQLAGKAPKGRACGEGLHARTHPHHLQAQWWLAPRLSTGLIVIVVKQAGRPRWRTLARTE